MTVERGAITRIFADRGHGDITVEGSGNKLFFRLNDIATWDVLCIKGERVEFEIAQSGRQAIKIRRPAGYTPPAWLAPSPSDQLLLWSNIQLHDSTDKNGVRHESVLRSLAAMAQKEDWLYGETPNPAQPFPILKNYLIYTFYKLQQAGSVREVSYQGNAWAAFNTGLVDDHYEAIYGLFKKNDRPPRRWKFVSFCRANIGKDGQILVDNFNPLPPVAKYFNNPRDVIFDPDDPIHPRYDHIIYDGIERDRFPAEFLRRHVPAGMSWQDPASLQPHQRNKYLGQFRKSLEADVATSLSVRRRMNDAVDLAVKRARWNYKTAIPLYYPRDNSISLLLPIALVSDSKVDLALVVNRTIADNAYSAETVYKLKWAYEHARLVCRPLSDWLTPEAANADPEDFIADGIEPAELADATGAVDGALASTIDEAEDSDGEGKFNDPAERLERVPVTEDSFTIETKQDEASTVDLDAVEYADTNAEGESNFIAEEVPSASEASSQSNPAETTRASENPNGTTRDQLDAELKAIRDRRSQTPKRKKRFGIF